MEERLINVWGIQIDALLSATFKANIIVDLAYYDLLIEQTRWDIDLVRQTFTNEM